MHKMFTIRYRIHWCGPCQESEDTKAETVIKSDGRVSIRKYAPHEPDGHFRIIDRGNGFLSEDAVQKLYLNLQHIIQNHLDWRMPVDDMEVQIILEEPGIITTIDAGLTDGIDTCESIIEEALKTVDFNWIASKKEKSLKQER